jgi:hypothetical protein
MIENKKEPQLVDEVVNSYFDENSIKIFSQEIKTQKNEEISLTIKLVNVDKLKKSTVQDFLTTLFNDIKEKI